MTAGRSLPWLQDTTTENVQAAWNVSYRDVVILDPANERPVAAFSLTTNDLAVEANRAQLKDLILSVAQLKDDDGDKLSDFWEEEMFGGTSPGPSDDGDGDSAINLLEYGHGSHPGDPASQPRFTIGFLDNSGERHLFLTFRRRLGNAGGLRYLLEFSESLGAGPWGDGPPDMVVTSRLNPYDGTGTEIVTYRAVLPFSALPDYGFLRVRCTLP